MLFEENETFKAATCGVVLENEYILWSSWENGDLYKIYLKDNRIEFVSSTIKAGHYGKAFGCMIRNEEKIYLVCLFDCYEIMEYDIRTGMLRLLYQHIMEGLQIFHSFLIEGKMYLLPNKLSETMCIYSLEDGEAIYVKWKELLSDINFSIEDEYVHYIDCLGKNIYGTIYNTPYTFCIETSPILRCKVERLQKNYKLTNINVIEGKRYFIPANRELVLCLNRNLEIEEIKLFQDKENVYGKHQFVSSAIYKNDIFLIPFSRDDKITVINRFNGNKKVLEYPKEFEVINENGRLFWIPIIYKDKIYLLPHCGSGILVLDLYTYKMNYIGWELKLNIILKYRLLGDMVEKQELERQDIGHIIYKDCVKESIAR